MSGKSGNFIKLVKKYVAMTVIFHSISIIIFCYHKTFFMINAVFYSRLTLKDFFQYVIVCVLNFYNILNCIAAELHFIIHEPGSGFSHLNQLSQEG